jgi:hypothetical protein
MVNILTVENFYELFKLPLRVQKPWSPISYKRTVPRDSNAGFIFINQLNFSLQPLVILFAYFKRFCFFKLQLLAYLLV